MKKNFSHQPEVSAGKRFVSVLLAALLSFSNCAFLSAEGESAGGGGGSGITEDANQYGFGPEGQQIENVENYGKPVNMVSILPSRPVAARDKDGNKMFYTPDGKLTLKISKDGKREFSLKSFTLERDSKGEIASTSKFKQGSDKMVMKNEKGEVTGFQQMGLGGKVVKEYDYEGNITKSTHYNQYGKSTLWVTDELSQTKTVFNSKNQAVCDINYEGFEVAWYKYDDKGTMTEKTDGYGNKTYFGKEGMTYSEDADGNKTTMFDYRKDDKGYVYLAAVTDLKSKQTTNYDRLGRKTETVNEAGEVVKEYKWDGTTLLCDFDHTTKETTYYDVLQRPRYKAQGDVLTEKWMYYKGKLVGDWDQGNDTTMIYKNQREEIRIETGPEAPSEQEISELVDAGLVEEFKKEYSDNMIKSPLQDEGVSGAGTAGSKDEGKSKFFQSQQKDQGGKSIDDVISQGQPM